MYILEPRARIKKESTIIVIAEKVVSRRFAPIFEKSFRDALATAKPSGGGTP
jgi:hypothetical protein